MTGKIFKIQRHSLHDGPGIRTTVFFKGCPLHCEWCFNPESHDITPNLMYSKKKCIDCKSCEKVCPENAINITEAGYFIDKSLCTSCFKCVEVCLTGALKVSGRTVTSEEVVAQVLKDKPFYRSSGGVTLSGGEILTQSDFAIEILQLCKKEGVNTVIETCALGNTEALMEILEYTDLALMDIKILDNEKHKKHTGVGNELILKNIRKAAKAANELIICVPCVPGLNDSDEEIREIARFVKDELKTVNEIRLHPYTDVGETKYEQLFREYVLKGVKPPTDEHMEHLKCIVESFGLSVRIGG